VEGGGICNYREGGGIGCRCRIIHSLQEGAFAVPAYVFLMGSIFGRVVVLGDVGPKRRKHLPAVVTLVEGC